MRYPLLIVDFDGTLADSFPFFCQVFNQLAQRHGFRPVAGDEVAALRQCSVRQIARQLGLPLWKLPRVARHFTQLMHDAPDSAPLFPGMAAVLDQLLQQGVTLALVSSNARRNVARSLGEARLARFAAVECGSALLGKAYRLRQVAQRCQVRPEQAIYVGDQQADGDAARRAGMAFAAVSWGYASLDSLRQCQPVHCLHQVEDFLLLGRPGGNQPIMA